jgi:hypothetical protein
MPGNANLRIGVPKRAKPYASESEPGNVIIEGDLR